MNLKKPCWTPHPAALFFPRLTAKMGRHTQTDKFRTPTRAAPPASLRHLLLSTSPPPLSWTERRQARLPTDSAGEKTDEIQIIRAPPPSLLDLIHPPSITPSPLLSTECSTPSLPLTFPLVHRFSPTGPLLLTERSTPPPPPNLHHPSSITPGSGPRLLLAERAPPAPPGYRSLSPYNSTMDNAPPQLNLSVLTWKGWPSTLGDGDEYSGTYSQAALVRTRKGTFNAGLAAIEYIPAATTKFRYMRRSATGTEGSTVTYEGGIAGENVPPLMRIALPGRLHWPERFRECDFLELERKLTGPPFKFFDIDWHMDCDDTWDPSRLKLHSVNFDTPDLPGQPPTAVDPERTQGAREEDCSVGLGWCGDWATALLEKQDRNQALGERTEIMWNNPVPGNADWGAEVRLEAIRVGEPTDYDDLACENPEETPKRCISDYEVRATVLRIFVKSEAFARLQQPDEVQSEEEEEDEEDVDWY
ncbi:hypothetical protein C8R46DRAFT_1232398 [Mycena filopes]|nr:hypothetical protein C8R46DRAFT_1232398 [Mycena filopes]